MPAPPHEPRRLAAPWTVIEHPESFEVRSSNGLRLAFIYFNDERVGRDMQRQLTKDEAGKVARNIAKLPDLLKH